MKEPLARGVARPPAGAKPEEKSRLILALSRPRKSPPAEARKWLPGVLRSLRKEDPKTSLRLASDLAAGELNAFGESALALLVDSIDAREALTLSAAGGHLLYGVLARRPALGADVEFWRTLQHANEGIVDAILSARPPKPLLRRIVAAMLEAGEDARGARLVDLSPDAALGAALDWLAEGPKPADRLGPHWQRRLERHPEALLDWLSRRTDAPLETIAAAARSLDPDSRFAREVPLEVWNAISARVSREPSENFLSLRAFLLATALGLDSSRALGLMEQNVPAVHTALAGQRLDASSWGMLERRLPPIDSWWAWDRCERLRRGAIRMLARNGGSLANLLRDAEAKTIQYLTKSCLATAEGRELLHRAI